MPGARLPDNQLPANQLRVDLHTHSRFAMSTSPLLDIDTLAAGARRKGLDLLTTGDFTHPVWLDELKSELTETSDGVFESHTGGKFILGTEISCVWKQDGRGRRVHLLVLAPGFDAVDAICEELARLQRLESDGRPILKISARDLAEIVWTASDRCVVIPAHVWTPWYGLYGSKSGFDSLEECFGDLSGRIRAIETGLSSDPAMNWRVPDLDSRSIVSFSDAHSPASLGREFTVIQSDLDYDAVTDAIQICGGIVETVEFFPENGKYHLNGHRKCGIRLEPHETPEDGRCPACSRPLTLGVLQRLEELSDRPALATMTSGGLISGPAGRPPFRRLVQLADLVSDALGVGPKSRTVARACDALVDEFGNELTALLHAPIADITYTASPPIASAIDAVRRGRVDIQPGYDGVYGTVSTHR
ncbi:MAG: DNA helicase UvrD [Chloroflexi bacterium]|nr:DNA helicase UvrD [Chloroflexota bacterium]